MSRQTTTSRPDGAGAPADRAFPVLKVWGGQGRNPAVRIDRPICIVGRRGMHISLDAPTVSRTHALIVADLTGAGGAYVRDLASRNGISVNGAEVRESPLADATVLRVGEFALRCESGFGSRGNGAPAAGSTAPPATLAVDGHPVPIPPGQRTVLIGRREGCDVELADDAISTTHAVIAELGDRRFVRDLGSEHGTFVNGQKVKQQVLADGDEILVGNTTITYTLGAAAGADALAVPAADDSAAAWEDALAGADAAAVDEATPDDEADAAAIAAEVLGGDDPLSPRADAVDAGESAAVSEDDDADEPALPGPADVPGTGIADHADALTRSADDLLAADADDRATTSDEADDAAAIDDLLDELAQDDAEPATDCPPAKAPRPTPQPKPADADAAAEAEGPIPIADLEDVEFDFAPTALESNAERLTRRTPAQPADASDDVAAIADDARLRDETDDRANGGTRAEPSDPIEVVMDDEPGAAADESAVLSSGADDQIEEVDARSGAEEGAVADVAFDPELDADADAVRDREIADLLNEEPAAKPAAKPAAPSPARPAPAAADFPLAAAPAPAAEAPTRAVPPPAVPLVSKPTAKVYDLPAVGAGSAAPQPQPTKSPAIEAVKAPAAAPALRPAETGLVAPQRPAPQTPAPSTSAPPPGPGVLDGPVGEPDPQQPADDEPAPIPTRGWRAGRLVAGDLSGAPAAPFANTGLIQAVGTALPPHVGRPPVTGIAPPDTAAPLRGDRPADTPDVTEAQPDIVEGHLSTDELSTTVPTPSAVHASPQPAPRRRKSRVKALSRQVRSLKSRVAALEAALAELTPQSAQEQAVIRRE